MPSLSASTDSQDSQYALDKVLYDSTLSVRDEMNLITERVNKMEEHKSEVSEAVYLKVKSDYLAKFDQVKKTFESKKLEIQKALQNLYLKQKEQEVELQKHQEVLEEAKFRNFLGEFSDKKFKEVENRENADLKRYENILSLLQSNIKQYEDLIGGPAPEPVIAPPPPPSPKAVLSEPPVSAVKPMAAPPAQESAPLPKKEEAAPPPPKTIVTEEEGDEDFYAGLEGEYFEAEEEETKKPPTATEPRRTTSKTKSPEPPAPAPVERMKTEKLRPIKGSESSDEPVTSKTEMKEDTPALPKAAPKSAAGMGFDDSISSILRSIPLEDEEEEAKPEPVETKMPLPEAKEEEPPSITHVEDQPSKPVLICIEGELDPSEIQLGENTSMGRSPSNDIVLKEAKVSRQHAAINFLHGDYVLVDLKSSNGVFVNGQKIEEHTLKDGDEISVGSFRLLYRSHS